MRTTGISAGAAAALSIISVGCAWAQVSAGSGEAARQNQAPATQEMQNDGHPPPGAENYTDKRTKRAQTAVPMDQMMQGLKPADNSKSN
jgi:hypothetical protein